MTKTVGLTLLICAIPLLAIGAWYLGAVHSANARADQFQSEAQNRKLVPVEILVSVPENTPADQALYVSGSAVDLGNWDAKGLRMERREDGKYHGTANVMSGVEYGYKITRGTWGTVETDAGAQPIANRTLKADQPGKVEVAVAGWIDGGKTVPGRITAVSVKMEYKFASKILGNERNIAIFLPPGYDDAANKDVRYPVLYMHDGQNLFDESTSFAGIEWKVDETATKLMESQKIQSAIIVGIYNAGEQRTAEFTPPPLASSPDAAGEARADLYAKFLVEELKPFIDKTYRTQPDRAHTMIAGASMGGLISLWIVKTHPDVFSGVALLSPWLRIGDKKIIGALGDPAWTKNLHICLEMGDQPGQNYPGDNPIGDARELAKYLDAAGVMKNVLGGYQYEEIQGLKHEESGFQSRVEPMLTCLLGRQST